ncbi:MAG: DUF262 domain-containing HNH endonuclease family protein [Mycoplasma sp.]|nr:DUF262 domain-containing HNH endonuclease family protein [Mycoplasma sp.]
MNNIELNYRKLNDEYGVFLDNQRELFDRMYVEIKKYENGNMKISGEFRKILENIFATKFKYSEGTLNANIKKLTNQVYVPPVITQALYIIKFNGNNDSHERFEDGYEIDPKIVAEETFRSMWYVLKWIALNGKEDFDFKYKESASEIKYNENLSNVKNDFRAQKLTMSQLIFKEGYSFSIPSYQRDYKWGVEENISKLFNDLLQRTKDKKTHYLGSIAVSIDSNKKIIKIIDGQQRISTFLLLIKAFIRVYEEKGIIFSKELEDFKIKKIKTIYKNKDILEVQRSLKKVLLDIKIGNKENKLPEKNYEFFVMKLNELNISQVEEMFNTFTTGFIIALLTFDTNNSPEVEMDIFENLNTGGVKLSEWDLIRNYLFSQTSLELFLEQEDEINRSINRNILIPLNTATNNKSDKVINSMFEIFNRIKSIEWKRNNNGNLPNFKRTYDGFKFLWSRKRKFQTLNEFNDQLLKINELILMFIELKYSEKIINSKLNPYSHILKTVNRDDVMPLLMISLKEYCQLENGEVIRVGENFIKILRIIESYYVRSEVYGNNLSQFYDIFLMQIDNFNNIETRLFKHIKQDSYVPFVSDSQFEEFIGQRRLRKTTLTSILTHLELMSRGISLGEHVNISLNNSHEHILAKKLDFNKYDDYKKINKTQYEELQRNYLDSLGNALILSTKANSKASNKPFIEKISYYKESSMLSKGLKGKSNTLIPDLTSEKKFTYKDVKKRAKIIAEYVIKNKIYYNE